MRELVAYSAAVIHCAAERAKAPERVSKGEPVPLQSVSLVGAERAVMRR